MPQAMPVIAAVGAVASVGGTVMSLSYQKKALEAQKKAAVFNRKAAKQQRVQQDLATTRSNRQAIREAQLARARALMSSVGAGSFFSSGAEGGIGGISSQLGSGLGFATQYNSMSDRIARLGTRANNQLGQANQYSGTAQMFSGIASLGGQLFNAAGGFGAFGGQQSIQTQPLNYTPTYSQPTPTPPPSGMAYRYNPPVRPYGYN